MATFDKIAAETRVAWAKFAEHLEVTLAGDFNRDQFFHLVDTCKVDDYVMQATDFGVNCPSCGVRLDNEDDLQGIGCINCDTEYK